MCKVDCNLPYHQIGARNRYSIFQNVAAGQATVQNFAGERPEEIEAGRAGLIRADPESARKADRRVNSRGFDVSAYQALKRDNPSIATWGQERRAGLHIT